jgi:hypothetical protein
MITYKEILEKSGIISEEEFNEMIKYIPKDVNINYLDIDCAIDLQALCTELINTYLTRFMYCYADLEDFNSKKLYINDVYSINDLESINSELSNLGWTLVNYKEEKDALLEEQEREKEEEECKNLILKIKNKLCTMTKEQLEELYEEL